MKFLNNAYVVKNGLAFWFGVLLLFQALPVSAEDPLEKKDRAEHLGLKLYTGELHTHTSLSDGIKYPKDAYQFVKEHTNLDFYGVTEHDVTFDVSSNNDYLQSYKDSYSAEYKQLHEESNKANGKDLVALPGVEVTWYDGAGHMNLFNTEWFPRTYGKGAPEDFGMGNIKYDLPTFYARLAEDPKAIAQFNHPGTDSGSFFHFAHYNKDVDKQINLMEYKYSASFPTYIAALNKGWHISPTYGGDEHTGNWGASTPNLTGMWAKEPTRKAMYEAMTNRRTYSSFDENFELTYSANGKMMGSILSKDTKSVNIHMNLKDPDEQDTIEKAVIYKKNGAIVKEYAVGATVFNLDESFPAHDGDYFFVRVFQKDNDEIISAPIWVGETTGGTDSSPRIKMKGTLPANAKLGDEISVPHAEALDDSGEKPKVNVEVFDSKGKVKVENNTFTIGEYGQYFVKYKTTDSKGNTRVLLKRITISEKSLDGGKLLNEFQPTVSIGAKESEAGVTLVADEALHSAFVQYSPANLPAKKARIKKTKVSYFESAYGDDMDTANYRTLASHEGDLAGLKPGTTYKYRFGMTPHGPWSKEFSFETATASGKKTMYVMGDLQVPDGNPKSFQLFNDMLGVLTEKSPGGRMMMQVGDLVDYGGYQSKWDEATRYIYKDLHLMSANMVGNHEVKGDPDGSTFSHFFNLPENGEGNYKETNYSFDYGDAHIAVINSMNFTDEQLTWLAKDMRATEKKWKILMGHFPYYGASHSDDPGVSTARAKISKLTEQLGISLYIGGHDHVYKRTTVRTGKMDNRQESMDLGTTFVTMGSSGPKFYGNESYWWDHIVYDDNVQTGVVLEADQQKLKVKAYNNAGTVIDEFAIGQPKNYFALTSVDIKDTILKGAGLLNYPGAPDQVTIGAAKYDASGTKLLDLQTKTVKLEHLGREQMITFKHGLKFTDQNTVKVYVWDNLKDRNPLVPEVVARKAMDGAGTAQNPYKIDSIKDFENIKYYPDKHFALTKDIEGGGQVVEAIGSGDAPFTGVFDGQGHSIKEVKAVSDGGAGLFRINNGTIKNVAVLNAKINVASNDVGILADTNNGTIDSSYTTGSITGRATVGGIAGHSNGIIRNSYSTAKVKAEKKQAGGVAGITNRGSLTENSYSTGSVTAGEGNAGGISGYGYNNTVIENNIALNPSVITISWANRIVAKVLAGEQATLTNNFANKNLIVNKEGVGTEHAGNEKGLGKSQEEINDPKTYQEGLGWDFDQTWTWDDMLGRPVLQKNKENAVSEGSGTKPDLPKNESGSYVISFIKDLAEMDRFPKENYSLSKDLDFEDTAAKQLAADVPFLGTFDGHGHVIKNMKTTKGALFHINAGIIKNIGIIDADVKGESGAPQAGILVNLNQGTIDRSYTTGSIIGGNTIGGLAGYSNGVIQNSYSQANVRADGKQAGGLVGITNRGSVTKNVYAAGNVAAGSSNAGGLSGYGYNDTTIQNSIALNPSVNTPVSANRIVGRVLAGEKATLVNNFADAAMSVNKEGIPTESGNNEKGLGKNQNELAQKRTFEEGLGWNFDKVWKWDDTLKRPVLLK
ncbi:CehA/McbA family metallohydrolase [Fictibacillus sp. NRS-1165]|uniref:CehA/McbA family metallohydrolase n=1 Tax=Fictibacillus sp. NRS-1165 TaxID=3144463 RepID=UPI003D247048